jgi:hypothetical protein
MKKIQTAIQISTTFFYLMRIKNSFGVPKALFGILPGRVTYVADKTELLFWF